MVDRLGKKCVTAELLQPDELISGMISQVAAEPEMALLLNHFIYSTSGAPPSLTLSCFLETSDKTQLKICLLFFDMCSQCEPAVNAHPRRLMSI